jgi:HEPN domain-containing protein
LLLGAKVPKSDKFTDEETDSQIAYWLDLADYDMETAHSLLAGGRRIYVGYMCHLVAEKALKAAVTRATRTFPPRIHALVELAERAGLYAQMSADQRKLLDALDPLNIEARYPAERKKLLASLTEERCRELVAGTEELLTWVKTQLSPA